MLATHVLLIQVDQWNAQCLSLLGHPDVRTPHLDRLATEGRLYTQARANNPICMPSRASMLAGRYPSTIRQYGFTGYCPPGIPWLHKVFKERGYVTGAFGKFHTLCVGHADWTFDVAAPTLPEDVDLSRPKGNNYRDWCRQHGYPWPNDQIHGHTPPPDAARAYPLSSHSDPSAHTAIRRHAQSDVPLEASLETYTTGRCVEFLEERGRDHRPFFAWLTYDRPHNPSTLPAEWWARRLDPTALTLPPQPSADEIARFSPRVRHGYAQPWQRARCGDEQFRFTLAAYLTLCEWIDAEIGKVMECLHRTGLDAQTTVVFTSDHGDEAGRRGLYDKLHFTASEEIVRVPLMIRPAPVLRPPAAGRLAPCDAPVELVDLYATVLELAGIQPSAGHEGISLAPNLLADAPLDPCRIQLCEEYQFRSLVRDGWKLVYSAAFPEEVAVYDLTADPDGLANRAADPAARAQRLALKRALLADCARRLFGGYDARDVERIRRALDPDGGDLGLCVNGHPQQYTHFRAAGYIQDAACALLVPYYAEELMLFPPGAYYKATAMRPFDPETAERLLDVGLAPLVRALDAQTVSVFNWWKG